MRNNAQYTYTLSLSTSSAVEIMFLLNVSSNKCCTYRFYYRDVYDVSYAKIDNDTTTATVEVTTQGDGTFNFTLNSYSQVYIKRLIGEYTLT